MNIKDIKGLKYPDEYFIKFFFKFKLHNQNNKRYLEFGCSNGCNLILPYQFGNEVIGIDLNTTLIDYANENFKNLRQKESFSFYAKDMREFCKNNSNINADVLILANSIYYIPKNDMLKMFQNIQNNKLIKKNIPFFIRFRNIDDFRNNKGEMLSKNSLIMQNGITGEDGVFCQFYEIDEMIELLNEYLNLRDFDIMEIRYQNIQNNTKVDNSDIVIWGYIN
jgi:SAM-dependent methyltransferase